MENPVEIVENSGAFFHGGKLRFSPDPQKIPQNPFPSFSTKLIKKANESLLVAANDENNTTFIRETAWKTLATMMEEIRSYNEASSYYRQLVEMSPKVENYMLYGNYCYRRQQFRVSVF